MNNPRVIWRDKLLEFLETEEAMWRRLHENLPPPGAVMISPEALEAARKHLHAPCGSFPTYSEIRLVCKELLRLAGEEHGSNR